jgi:muconolactone delta-isomerase
MRYVVSFVFNRPPDMALIPAEQARAKELEDAGQLQSVLLAADRSRGWLLMQCDSDDAVRTAVESLPLHPFMDVQIHALMDR